jgi:hypothetical protein
MDCNVHQLRLPSVPDNTNKAAEGPGSTRARWSDNDTSPVVSVWQSKELNLGSWAMVKQFRQVIVDAYGTNVTVKHKVRLVDGTSTDWTLLPDTSIPFESDDVPDIESSPRLGKSIQIRVEGQNLDLREIALIWRGLRFRSNTI